MQGILVYLDPGPRPSALGFHMQPLPLSPDPCLHSLNSYLALLDDFLESWEKVANKI